MELRPSSLTAIVRTQIALRALRAKINLLFFERKYIKMSKHPELIVMLTHNDRTVENAYEIFDACKDTKAKYWGFKEVGIPLDEMKKLCSYMKACGKTTFLYRGGVPRRRQDGRGVRLRLPDGHNLL